MTGWVIFFLGLACLCVVPPRDSGDYVFAGVFLALASLNYRGRK